MVSHAVPRPRLPRGPAGDAALAGGVLVLVAVGSLRSLLGAREESWESTALGWALLFVACAALYACRRHPVPAAAFVLAATIAYYLVSAYDGPLMVAFVVALYVVAAQGLLRAAIVLAALGLLLTGTGTLLGNEDVNGVALFMMTGWLVGVVALGWVRHNRLVLARETEQRAVSEERLRIARELHDVVGHHLSLINVQSAAALRRLRKDPAGGAGRAEDALGAIKDASKEALRELRATLGVLRQADEAAPTAPAAGLARLGELVEAARLAGLDVRLLGDGTRGPLPAEVDLAAYRIVQESLTNVARHAHATRVTVRTGRGPRHLTVEITDDGRGPASAVSGAPAGSGISGMRERARALGGELTAGRAPDGGFRVHARLPCPPSPVPDHPDPSSGSPAPSPSSEPSGSPSSAPSPLRPPPPLRPLPLSRNLPFPDPNGAPVGDDRTEADPRRAGGRPAAGARRVPFHPGGRGRHRGRRRGGRRGRGPGGLPRPPPRRRPAGRPDARRRRSPGRPRHRGGPAADGRTRGHPDHLRPGRLRLRRPARRGHRLPGEGHRTGGTGARRAGRGPRRRPDQPSVTRRLIAEFAGRVRAPTPARA